MRKNILLVLIIFLSVALIFALIRFVGVTGLASAWALNFLLMLCVSVFIGTLKANLTSDYFKEKTWENQGKIYEKLGINVFRKLLVFIGWEKITKQANPVKKNLDALIHLEYETKQSELSHLIIFFIVLGFTIYVAVKHGVSASLWLLFLNVVLHVYPVFLQRYNRPRIQRAIKLIKYREG